MDDTNHRRDETVADLRREYDAALEHLLTYDEVCEALTISRVTLSRLARAQKLTRVQVGRDHYITRASVIAHIQELSQAVRSPRPVTSVRSA